MHSHRPIPLLLVALIATFGLLSIPGALAQDSPATPESDARAMIARASDRLADTQTMQFELEVDGDSYIDESNTMRIVAARGDLARPDMVDVEFQINILGAQNVTIRMISIGKDSWTTDLLTGKWGPSPPEFGYNPSVLFDNQEGLGPVAGRLQNPTVEGSEEVGGRDAWKITGTVDEETIEPLTSGVIKGDEIGISIWIDKENDNILRIVIEEPEIEGKENPATWTMTLTGHGNDVEIEAPDTGD
jgi:lipoprotein LprG